MRKQCGRAEEIRILYALNKKAHDAIEKQGNKHVKI